MYIAKPTESDKYMLYKNIDSKRRNFIRSAESEFYSALNKQGGMILKAYREGRDIDLTIFSDKNPILESFEKVYVQVGVSFAEYTLGQVSLSKQKEVWERAMLDYVRTVAGEKITNINLVSLKKAREIIERASREFRGTDVIARELRREWTGKRLNVFQAKRIARTEVIPASNFGSLEGAKQAGIGLVKVWLSTRDNRTRDPHFAADGQKVQLYSKFNVGGELLEYPGDPAGSAGNVIQCRCTQIYEPI